MKQQKHVALASTATTACVLIATGALAAQGPGTAPGSASGLTQTAMAILIYGLCAATVAIGLLRGLRR